MTNSLRFNFCFSNSAWRFRFLMRHVRNAVAATDGTPMATPTPIATGVLILPDPLSSLFDVG